MHRDSALQMQHATHIRPGRQSNRELDGQVITSPFRAGHRRAQPLVNLRLPGLGNREELTPLIIYPSRLDQTVTLKPLQRRVHLSDVQWPVTTSAFLERRVQLIAATRPLTQQAENAQLDGRRHTY